MSRHRGARHGAVAAWAVMAGLVATALTPAMLDQDASAAILCFGKRATIVGSGAADRLVGTRRSDVIVGLGGNDRIEGRAGNDYVCGGPGDDTIKGGSGDDWLNGGDGSDTLVGQAGNDTIKGGAGTFDIAAFLTSSQGVKADLGKGQATGEGSDSLASIEGLVGSRYSDVLRGDARPNYLFGLGGDDTLRGLEGYDLAGFLFAAGPVTASLATGTATGEGRDTLGGVEGLIGGPTFGDVLTGNGGANYLLGWGGDDTLNGLAGDDILFGADGADSLRGGDGNDVLLGGAGNDGLLGGGGTGDLASFETAPGPVAVDLSTGLAAGDGNDVLSGIEGLYGSDFDDILVGSQLGDMIAGLDGDDDIAGLAGDDRLFGDGGINSLDGGDGFDSCETGGSIIGCEGGASSVALRAGRDAPAVMSPPLPRRDEPGFLREAELLGGVLLRDAGTAPADGTVAGGPVERDAAIASSPIYIRPHYMELAPPPLCWQSSSTGRFTIQAYAPMYVYSRGAGGRAWFREELFYWDSAAQQLLPIGGDPFSPWIYQYPDLAPQPGNLMGLFGDYLYRGLPPPPNSGLWYSWPSDTLASMQFFGWDMPPGYVYAIKEQHYWTAADGTAVYYYEGWSYFCQS